MTRLGASNLDVHSRAAAPASLERLPPDRIDLSYAHWDDPGTLLADTVAAFDGLVRSGEVRVSGASNDEADRLAEALQARTVDKLLELLHGTRLALTDANRARPSEARKVRVA